MDLEKILSRICDKCNTDENMINQYFLILFLLSFLKSSHMFLNIYVTRQILEY